MPYDNFDRFIPHKRDIKMSSKINNSTNYDIAKAAILDGAYSDLEAQAAEELNVKDTFKVSQEERGEPISNDEKKYTDLFVPIKAYSYREYKDFFIPGNEVTLLRNTQTVRSSFDNMTEHYFAWSTDGILEGFSSVKDYYVLIEAVFASNSLDDVMFIFEKLIKAGYKDTEYAQRFLSNVLHDRDYDTEESKYIHIKNYLIEHIVTPNTVLMRIPLGFNRLENIRKNKIIDGCTIYSVNLDDNEVEQLTFIVRNDTITEIEDWISQRASLIYKTAKNKKDEKYLVDESLEAQASDHSLVTESVYPAIGESLLI